MIFESPFPSQGEYLACRDTASKRIILTAREALILIPPVSLLSEDEIMDLAEKYAVWIPMQNNLSQIEMTGIVERCGNTILPCFIVGDPLP